MADSISIALLPARISSESYRGGIVLLDRLIGERDTSATLAFDSEFLRRLKAAAQCLEDDLAILGEAAVACAVVLRAAKSFKIDSASHSSPLTLESAVFEAGVRDLVDQIKANLSKVSSGDSDRLETLLREELSHISSADADAIRKATGVEDLSAKALLGFLTTTSSTVIASLVVGGLGCGPFVALTTAMKAITLLVGVTLPFAAYTAASSTLALLLSGPFLLAVLAVIGSVGWKRADNAIRDQLVRLVIMVGTANTLDNRIPAMNA